MKKSLFLVLSLFFALTVSAGNLTGYRIGLDAGHGGSDPGASGGNGAPHEATLCLKNANALKTKLQNDGCGIMMTRSSDVFVGLSARASKFIDYDPYIALAIHLNALNGSAYGTETWYCKTSGNSYSLASSMHQRMVATMRDGALGCATAPTKGGKTFARGVKQTCWTVISISASIPATLTEGLFIDNKQEHTYLKGDAGFNSWMMGHLYGCYTHMNKCVNGNIPATPPGGSSLSVSPTSLAFGSVVNGQYKNLTVKVSMSGISSATVTTSNNTNFKTSHATVSNGSTLTIGFYPNASDKDFSGTITISGGGKTAKVTCTGRGVPVPKSINPASTSVSFGDVVIKQTSTKTVNITSTNLTGNISVSSSDNSLFTVSPTSLPAAGGTISIVFKPTEVGNKAGTITLTSSGADTKTISLSGKGKGIPINLQQVWNYSQRNGLPSATDAKKAWAADPLKIRNCDYAAGALYVVNAADAKITKVNARTGESLGELNTAGVDGGALKLCDVKYLGGKIIACNATGNPAEDPFKVYIWDNENLPPRVFLQTNLTGKDCIRIGDCIGLEGNLTSGTLLFGGRTSANKNIIMKFAITNGVCSTNPTLQTMVDLENKEMYFGNSVRVQSAGNGKYWCNGQNFLPTLFGEDGKMTTTLNHAAVGVPEMENGTPILNLNVSGNAFKAFNYGGVQYGVATRYNTNVGSNDTYKAGRFNLFDATEGWAKATSLGEYPSGGLGTSNRNLNCATSLAVAVNGDDGVEIWVSVLGQGIAYFKHGTPKTENPQPVVPSTDPVIAFNPTAVSIETIVGSTGTKNVEVSTANLGANVTLTLSGANANQFSLSTTNLAQTGGSFVVTYKPTVAGSHTAIVTAQSGATTKTLQLSGTAAPKIVLDDNITTMNEVWNYSTTKNNTASAPWLITATSDKFTRDIALMGNKLYILNGKAWKTEPSIEIINAKTGAKTGNLNMEGISGGEAIMSSIKVLGGKVIACNSARTQDALKIYKWDSDASKPTVWLEDATHGSMLAGGIMSVSGDMTNGRVWFADGDKVIYYNVSNGSINATANVITLSKTVGSQKGTADVTLNADGTIWVTGKDVQPSLYQANGQFIESLPSAAADKGGTSARFFTFGTKKYAAVASYLNKAASSLADGCVNIVNMTNGIPENHIGSFPANGLGITRNANFQTAVCNSIEEDGKVLYIWIMVSGQGIACYKYDGRTEQHSTFEAPQLAENTKMLLYNNAETLFVEGIEAQKIELFAVSGQKIATELNANTMNISNLKGAYIVVVTDTKGNRQVGKIVK